jgi:hypothetical protein
MLTAEENIAVADLDERHASENKKLLQVIVARHLGIFYLFSD